MSRSLDPGAFTSRVIKIAKRTMPRYDVECVGPLLLLWNRRHLDLKHVFRIVSFSPEQETEIIENYLQKMLEGESVSESSMTVPWSVAQRRVMPRIQPVSIFNSLDRELVAHIPFVNDTVVTYVIDARDVTVSLTASQLVQWGVPIDTVDMIARRNLENYSDFSIHLVDSTEGGRAAIIRTRDGYDASRLLLPNFYERLAPELKGNFLVATPARDLLLAITQGPQEFVDRIKGRVFSDHESLPYPISSEFFLVTRDGIAGTAKEDDDEY